MKPRLLAPLFSSPRQLLYKAQRDLGRLDGAIWAVDLTGATHALIDAAVSVYHVKDWIGVLHPRHKVAAQEHAEGSKWILFCREICHAGKHFQLDLKHPTYRSTPLTAERVGSTAAAAVGTYATLPMLKIFSQEHGDHYAPDVIGNAIGDWDRFLRDKNIP